jgi:hypothetical protein
VSEGKVDYADAITRTPDKKDLARRLGRDFKDD